MGLLDHDFAFPPVSRLKRYPATGVDVLIVGGGIGGLYAAMHCYRKGHNVRVLESSSELDLNGGFIRIGASVSDHLNVFPGLQEAFESVDYGSAMCVRDIKGEFIMPFHVLPSDGPHANAGRFIHRGNLLQILSAYVHHLGINVQMNTRVESFYEDAARKRGGCISKNGDHYEGDLVIAADGIGSHAGHLVMNDVQAKSSEYSLYRSTYSAELAYKNPNLEKSFSPAYTNGVGQAQMWIASHGYALIMSNKDVINFHLIHPDRANAKESWNHKADMETVLSTLKEEDWSQDIWDLVKAAPVDSVIDWKLKFRNPQPNWTSPHGYVLQIGDAAHSYLPHSANGATQAMEDSVSIASCLQLAGKEQVPLAARVHNKLRFERTSCGQKRGFINRNNVIGADVAALKEDPRRFGALVGKWITSHSPEDYVYEKYGACVNHLVIGTKFENTNIPPGHKYVPWNMDEFSAGRVHVEETGDWS